MSAKNKTREIPEIQQEYQQLCLRAGDLQYKKYCNDLDLKLINEKLRDLNLEAANSKRVADEEAAKQTPAEQQTGETKDV